MNIVKIPPLQPLFFLVLSTFFCGLLLLIRLGLLGAGWSWLSDLEAVYQVNGQSSFLFLLWNLLLAWVPYGLSRLLNPTRNGLLNGLIFLAWLLFFPNAPYILTDFLHLKDRWVVPHWFDLMLLFSFAWTGLLLGFASLRHVQDFIALKWSAGPARLIAFAALVPAAYGVFIGRFQRWNSWDVLLRPAELLEQAAQPLLHPGEHWHTLGLAVVLAGFLIIAYGSLLAFSPRPVEPTLPQTQN